MEIGRDQAIWESKEENKDSFPSDSLGVYLQDTQSFACPVRKLRKQLLLKNISIFIPIFAHP